MASTSNSIARITGAALAVTVITQILYIALSASGSDLATILWSSEAVAFLIIALGGAALIGSRPMLGAGLAIGGLLNVIQVGMGLVMFGPLSGAGEALGPVFSAVLAMAFFLYFAAKVAFGFAGLMLGRKLFKSASGGQRMIGGAAALTGLVAMIVNFAAMVTGMELVQIAGALGTLAAVFLALALWVAPTMASAQEKAV